MADKTEKFAAFTFPTISAEYSHDKRFRKEELTICRQAPKDNS